MRDSASSTEQRHAPRRARASPGALALAVALLGSVACRRAPEPTVPEVTILAGVGAVPVQVVSASAAQRGRVRLRMVERAADADLIWAADPVEVLDAAAEIAPGTAPESPGVEAKYRDPGRRWAPVCARARVLVVSPRAALPFDPRNLRDLADPRVAGRIAVPPLREPAHLTALAVLASVYGQASVGRFLELVDANRPVRVGSDAEVTASLARGDAALGLAGSEAAAAGAASAAGLEVVYPDQSGRGAVVVPTAIALTPKGAASEAARSAAEYLAGAEVERLLVARIPGLIPLRPDVPLPPGVRPAGNLVALPLAWDRIVVERRKLLERVVR